MTTKESDHNTAERNSKQNSLKERTKRFALEIIKLVEKLPKGRTADILRRQLLPAGTSAGANYRAACRARSSPDFIPKMGIVEEEEKKNNNRYSELSPSFVCYSAIRIPQSELQLSFA